jgi:hypothetical protein
MRCAMSYMRTRRRPSVPLAREAAAIDIRICIRRIEVIDDRPKAGGKRKSPGGNQPPGLSRFSTLFYVAAIGGKSPRSIDCADTLRIFGRNVKTLIATREQRRGQIARA